MYWDNKNIFSHNRLFIHIPFVFQMYLVASTAVTGWLTELFSLEGTPKMSSPTMANLSTQESDISLLMNNTSHQALIVPSQMAL